CLCLLDENGGFYMEHLCIGDIQKGPRGTNETMFSEVTNIPYDYLTGCLAESWEFLDPTTQLFHLRQGVMWMDKPGVMAAREFTAEDCVFALNRSLLEGPRAASGKYDAIKSFSAPDKYTFKVEYNEFYADWGYIVGWGYYSQIYPPEMVEADAENWRNACGTGPFMLTDFVSGAAMTFEKNP
ncbi:unnamed protein product, partial [marine sediment metagenome]